MQPFYMEQARSVSGRKPEDDELVAGSKRLGSNALLRQIGDIVQLECPHFGAPRGINDFQTHLRVGIANPHFENDTFDRNGSSWIVLPGDRVMCMRADCSRQRGEPDHNEEQSVSHASIIAWSKSRRFGQRTLKFVDRED